MDNKKNINIDKAKEFINNTSTTNLIIIFFFIIAVFLVMYLSVRNFIISIITPVEDNKVNFYVEDVSKYSIDKIDEYNVYVVRDYAQFFNTQDIVQSIVEKLSKGDNTSVYKTLSKDYVSSLAIEKDDILTKINSFYNENFKGIEKVEIAELDKIPDSNYFIVHVKNINNEIVKMVLNIDFLESTYFIEYIEM